MKSLIGYETLIAAAIVNQREYLGVYDFQFGGHLSISASNVQTRTPSFYDHNRGGAISGSLNGMYDFPSLACYYDSKWQSS